MPAGRRRWAGGSSLIAEARVPAADLSGASGCPRVQLSLKSLMELHIEQTRRQVEPNSDLLRVSLHRGTSSQLSFPPC